MPVLAASAPMFVEYRPDLIPNEFGRLLRDRCHAEGVLRGQCDDGGHAVRAAAGEAFRSAWMPAPPPESEEAIVSTRGITRLPPSARAPWGGLPWGLKATACPRAGCGRLVGGAARLDGEGHRDRHPLWVGGAG